MQDDGAPVEAQLESVDSSAVDPQQLLLTQEILDGGDASDRCGLTAAESGDVLDGLRMIKDSVRELKATVAKHHERSVAQEDLMQRMQDRIDELQRDQVRTLLGPVYEQLVSLHADLTEVADRDRVANAPDLLDKELRYLVTRVDSALQLLGLESVGAAPGVEFDSRLHAATRRVPTGTASRDRTIEHVSRQGFTFPGAKKVSMHARVTVYEYDPALDRDPAPDVDPTVFAEAPHVNANALGAVVSAADPSSDASIISSIRPTPSTGD